MTDASGFAAAAPRGDAAARDSHALPQFRGASSRRHRRYPLWRLRLRAAFEALHRRGALSRARTLVQFAGFPRSGHSLIGSILDAHPDAVVAHELDAMGLFLKGIPARRLPALMAWNAAAFSRHGRWWNGFRYEVAGAPATRPPLVVGDKKGDWAARWCAAEPDLLERLGDAVPLDCRWILVTRNPFDNVATMSLRRGGTYDRLRIGNRDGFREALSQAQAAGDVATTVDDGMVADYRALAAAAALMKTRVPPESWLEVVYEDFAADPRSGLTRIAAFLDLPPDPDWLASSCALVRPPGRRSRDALEWRDAQRAALRQAVDAHDFLKAYAGDE